MSTTLIPPSLTGRAPFGKSTLTEQLEQSRGERMSKRKDGGRIETSKPRSLSDASKPSQPTLSPSPAFREPRRISKDDSAVSPTTPRRSQFHSRGLSLQMPPKEPQDSAGITQLQKAPLSPQPDASNIYGSPASMIPRHSRGLDFTRACTNLHHSTLADSTPEGSPIAGRGIQIPQRRITASGNGDQSNVLVHGMWMAAPSEKPTLASSVSSVNMLDSSDSDSDESSGDMAIDREVDDPMLSTPAATRPLAGLFSNISHSPGSEWLNNPISSTQTSLMNFSNMMSYRRSRWRKGKSQHSSSSVSMRSSRPSPGPASPPIVKSVEMSTEGYFGGLTRQQVQSRRESLSLGTDDLHLSDSEENENKASGSNESPFETSRGVIRRAVTRRSNLLPKTKGFARIKAALLEESAPIDSELKREAEVIKQVNENDTGFVRKPSATSSTNSIADSRIESPEEDLATVLAAASEGTASSTEPFSQQAERNSAGVGFWNGFDQRYRTPPPAFLPRENSSALSDETLDTPSSYFANNSENPNWRHLRRSRSRSTTPLASNGPTMEDITRKLNKKRRRDDDFDPASFKRRAVSPGMSVQSSPVLPQSPVLTADKGWGRPPPKAQNDRSNSGGSTGGNGVKRIGLQGINETNEGLMSMSID